MATTWSLVKVLGFLWIYIFICLFWKREAKSHRQNAWAHVNKGLCRLTKLARDVLLRTHRALTEPAEVGCGKWCHPVVDLCSNSLILVPRMAPKGTASLHHRNQGVWISAHTSGGASSIKNCCHMSWARTLHTAEVPMEEGSRISVSWPQSFEERQGKNLLNK